MRVVVYSMIRLLGESLTHCLSGRQSVSLVLFCNRAERLVEQVTKSDADIVLFDMNCERSLVEARALGVACPDVRLLAIGIPEVAEEVIACADAGFSGYIPNWASIDDLAYALEQVLDGGLVCDPQIAGSLLREVWRRRSRKVDGVMTDGLTIRERDVLVLVARGLSNKEISHELSISVSTVKNHLHSVFAKLRVSGRAEALVRVRNHPWLVRTA